MAVSVKPEVDLLTRLLARLQPHFDIPLRLVLWNGAQHDLGTDPLVTVQLSGPRALRYFLPPSLDNLAEGYVNGLLDALGRAHDPGVVPYRLAGVTVPMRGSVRRLSDLGR